MKRVLEDLEPKEWLELNAKLQSKKNALRLSLKEKGVLKKGGSNDFDHYKYFSEAQYKELFTELFSANNLELSFDELEYITFSGSERQANGRMPRLQFILTDVETGFFEETTITGEGIDKGDKAGRFLSIKSLENDKGVDNILRQLPNGEEILKIRNKEAHSIAKAMNEDSEQAITDAKYGFISGALKETFTESHLEREQTTRVIDSIVTHRIWGYPIFFLFLYIMFEGTFVLGEYPMMGIEWLVEQLGNLVSHYMPAGPLKDLLVDGIIGGVGGVIVFLPNILILYFFISLLEDSGYMARAAFIMDKIMHRMGLHGKSFIPLIMGFGCNVPAIMASRMIEDRKCRLITMLVNPLMSCSARLPIYLVLVGAFFPSMAENGLACRYTIGWKFHHKWSIITLHEESAEQSGHQNGQKNASCIDAQQHRTTYLREKGPHQY